MADRIYIELAEAAEQLAVQLSPVKTARTEQNINVAHEMAERLKVELRRAALAAQEGESGEGEGRRKIEAAVDPKKLRALTLELPAPVFEDAIAPILAALHSEPDQGERCGGTKEIDVGEDPTGERVGSCPGCPDCQPDPGEQGQ